MKGENDASVRKIESATRVDPENQQQNHNDKLASPAVSSLPTAVAATDPKKILVEVDSAAEGNYLPLQTREMISDDQDTSMTDDDLDESLDISIGPKRDASSSEDVW